MWEEVERPVAAAAGLKGSDQLSGAVKDKRAELRGPSGSKCGKSTDGLVCQLELFQIGRAHV